MYLRAWSPGGASLYLNGDVTSQVASGLLLSSWNLERDIFFVVDPSMVSFGYFDMTVSFLRSKGLIIENSGYEYRILKNQMPKIFEYEPEPDMSSVFALSAFGAMSGKAVITNWIANSLQPDAEGIEILKSMGVSVNISDSKLTVSRCLNFKPIAKNLKIKSGFISCFGCYMRLRGGC